jgi:hypothetical protein
MDDNIYDPKELCVPIYLNQRIVFDLLAIFEYGFSQFTTLKTSSSDSETTKSSISATIGVSNIFALLGVSLSGERGKGKESQDITETSQEKVHTPTSLFSRCRSNLVQRKLLHSNIDEINFSALKSGDFVEFKAILHKNPIVDVLSWFKTFAEMIAPLYKQDKNLSQSNNSKNKFDKETISQINAILKMVTPTNTIELIGDLQDYQGVKAIISCEPDFFNRGDPDEIVDGEFYILGKIEKIVQENGEPINLLRKTTLGRLDSENLSSLMHSFSGLDNYGFKGVNFTTEIKGPAFIVIPVAIFL